jgi:general secretion pathway protein L
LTNFPRKPIAIWRLLIEGTAEALGRLYHIVIPQTHVQLVETELGQFDLRKDGALRDRVTFDSGFKSAEGIYAATVKGSLVNVRLHSSRFVYQELSFPAQAASLLRQIILNQVDRLTPWSADSVIFGFAQRTVGATSLGVSFVATPRAALLPLLESLADLRPQAAYVFAPASDVDPSAPIPLLLPAAVQRGSGQWLRRILSGVLIALLLVTLAHTLWVGWELRGLETRYASIEDELRDVRGGGNSLDPLTAEESDLFSRKLQGPVATLIIDELSRLLPDDTFLTDFELDDDKVEIAGLSQDASKIIGILEGSPWFSDATFSAPTTRQESEARERFHIAVKALPRGAQ